MNEIVTVMNEEEFEYFRKSFDEKANLKSLSLISRRCQVVDTLCGLQSDTVLTVGQIKQLFDLAKIKKSALISLARREALWKLVNYIIQNRRKLVKWNIYQDMTNGKHRLRNRNLQHIVIAVGVRCMKEIISIR